MQRVQNFLENRSTNGKIKLRKNVKREKNG